MGKIVATPEQVAQYFSNPSMGQSTLKKLLEGPRAYLEYIGQPDEMKAYYEDKGHFLIGGGVDMILTQSEEAFNATYHVMRDLEKKPSETMGWIIKYVFDKLSQVVESQYMDSIFSTDTFNEAVHEGLNIVPSKEKDKAPGYYTNRAKPTWQEDKRLDDVYKVIAETGYWNALLECVGKKMLSRVDYNTINNIVMSFRTHPAMIKYFNDHYIPENVDRYHQLAVYFEYMGVACKGLLDEVDVDHNAKTIQPYDVKTMAGATKTFLHMSFRVRRYDIQSAWYTKGLEAWKVRMGYGDYTVLPFKFLVESTTWQGMPLVFTCDNDILRIGETGLAATHIAYNDGRTVRYEAVKGMKQLMEDYIFYEEHAWSVGDREIAEHQNQFQLCWTNIY